MVLDRFQFDQEQFEVSYEEVFSEEEESEGSRILGEPKNTSEVEVAITDKDHEQSVLAISAQDRSL